MQLIHANWSVPDFVHALTTTRDGGVSVENYQSMNLATHVGDIKNHVLENRKRLLTGLQLKSEPIWLNQVHGNQVIDAHAANIEQQADASVTDCFDQVCVVLTADCLPVVFYNQDNGYIAAAHAGWRGLANGILDKTVKRLGSGITHAWMGPAIGPKAFEVGPEVKEIFLDLDANNEAAFSKHNKETGKCFANIYLLAKICLLKYGVNFIHGGSYCTFNENDKFFSYRRQAQCGRQATLIWKSDPN